MKILLLLSVLAFASDSFQAEYEVPVPEELAPYARFPMEAFRVKNKNGNIRVSYKLPLELTGMETHLRFEGREYEAGVVRLEGENGVMECRAQEEGQLCQVKYQRIEQDLQQVEALLRAQGFSEEVRSAKLSVAARFGGDLEGFIRYQNAKALAY